jgi:tight adherence protein B
MSSANLIFITQIMIILSLLLTIIYIIRFDRRFKLVKRISKYSVSPLTNNQVSFIDKVCNIYKLVHNDLSKILSKSKLVKVYSNRYSKYIDYLDEKKLIDFVANKILIIILFLIITLISDALKLKMPSISELVVVTAIGFYVPDIYNTINFHMRRKKIEHDLLNIIIMLNNAFKSGHSTMQAIEIVMNEAEGPMKDELTKMHTEISYGLTIENVFERFSKRVDIEEIKYITSSLAILNRTGGNIVKVFSSIERSLFSKRRLETELKSLTSSSRAMSKILLFLPFIFISVILLLNPDYFNSFFDNAVGLTILFTMISFYILYAILVQKVMKVRM